MNIIVWGLGYVGTVSAACLSELGHKIVGVDVNKTKASLLKKGISPIKEPGLDKLIKSMYDSERFLVTHKGSSFVETSNCSLICVGTPSKIDGDVELAYLENVCCDIAEGIKNTKKFHTIVLRSTVFPGVSRYLCEIIEQHSGKKTGEDFGFVMNPEFLREASAINDFYNPPYTVIGGINKRSSLIAASIYEKIEAPVFIVNTEEAEILKLANNAFHATKITFANEIGRICEKHNINGTRVMEMVVADKQLNISNAYMRPGFAFGGSCLPKDLRSLMFNGNISDVSLPLLSSLISSNMEQIKLARLKVNEVTDKSVGILGLSFKQGTDDVRESPVIELIRLLWKDGLDIAVYDSNIDITTMLGENLSFIERQVPQIKSIMVENINSIIKSKVIILTYAQDNFFELIKRLDSSYTVIDLVGIPDDLRNILQAQYVSLF